MPKLVYNVAMKNNYDSIFTQQKSAAEENSTLLLHVCCAPCATYCLTQLLDKFNITLYYANDNTTDPTEWQKRLHEVQKLVEIVNSGQFVVQPKFPLRLVVQQQQNSRFFSRTVGMENQKEGGERCNVCYNLRISDTFAYASQHNFHYFATTLTVSPYKNAQTINQIGLELQTDLTKWLCSDFKKRNGYNQSIQLAQQFGLYRQHYCGCSFSLRDALAMQNPTPATQNN